VHTFGGEIPRVPGAAIKNTCLIVCRLLSLQFRLFTASFPWQKPHHRQHHHWTGQTHPQSTPVLFAIGLPVGRGQRCAGKAGASDSVGTGGTRLVLQWLHPSWGRGTETLKWLEVFSCLEEPVSLYVTRVSGDGRRLTAKGGPCA